MIGGYLAARRRRALRRRRHVFEPNVWVQDRRRRQRAHHAVDARDGPGRDDVDADARGRGARRRLDEDQDRVGAGRREVRQPELRRRAADRRQQQRARHVEAAARGRRARRARCSSRPRRRRGASPRTRARPTRARSFTQASGRRLRYGALVDKAAALPVPKTRRAQGSEGLPLLGQSVRAPRHPEKVNGTAVFGIDVKRPGMLVARVVRCPVFGGKVASFNADKAKAVPGVARRADQQRRRRRRRQLLGGDEGRRRRSRSSGTRARSRR